MKVCLHCVCFIIGVLWLQIATEMTSTNLMYSTQVGKPNHEVVIASPGFRSSAAMSCSKAAASKSES